jgi:hypothetical protein
VRVGEWPRQGAGPTSRVGHRREQLREEQRRANRKAKRTRRTEREQHEKDKDTRVSGGEGATSVSGKEDTRRTHYTKHFHNFSHCNTNIYIVTVKVDKHNG